MPWSVNKGMAWSVLQWSYYLLAPLSVLAGVMLLALFVLVKELRLQRGWIVLWQCLSQSLLDLHWLSSSHFLSHSHNSALCDFIGTVSLYSFLLAYNYSAALSYVIIAYLKRPLKSVTSSMLSLHAVCHALAAAGALATYAAGNIGTSIMTTCFIASETQGEVIMMIPLVIHTPICLVACGYALRQFRKQYALRQFIWKHALVVVVFSSMWTLPSLLHFLNEGRIDQAKHLPVLLDVTHTQFSLVLGATSGLVTTIARLLEPGLIPAIITRFTGFLHSEVAASPGGLRDTMTHALHRESTDPIHQNAQEFAWTVLISLHMVLNREMRGVEMEEDVWKYEIGAGEMEGELGEFVRNRGEFRCEIREYAGNAFASLRRREGIADESLSMYSIIRSLDPPSNWPQVVSKHSISGGRSGSFFLKTYDNSLLIKTVSRSERKTLISRLIPRLGSHPQNSLLARIHGVFAIKAPGTLSEYVILMDNILQLPTDISETYDLKGSKLNREVGETAPFMPTKTLKDVDFLKRVHTLHLHPLDKDRLSEAIISDISLLSSLHLTDYSLFLALGEYPGDLSDLPPYFSRHLYRIEGSRTQVYSIGIIDYLETFGLRKKVETASKRLLAKEKDISSMNSTKYAERFLDMVRGIMDY